MSEEKEQKTKSGSSLEELKERLGKDPFAQFLGIRVLDLGEGWAQLEMPLPHQMSNFMGSIHGGPSFPWRIMPLPPPPIAGGHPRWHCI